MISARFDAVWQATWPAESYADAGGLRTGRGRGGGGRVSATRRTGPWSDTDIDAAEAQHRDWDQPPLFAVEDADTPLIAALTARGYETAKPTLILSAPIADLTDRPIPPVMALEHWPPLAILRDLWIEADIGPARQAVMHRASAPKAAILGRVEDRAAGAGFVSVHETTATLHALTVLPRFRRAGLADWIVRRAALFGAGHGADTLALAVTAANAPARALYDRLGFTEIGRYAYFQRG